MAAWTASQGAKTSDRMFPYDPAPRYLIFDRGASFNDDVVDTIKSFGHSAQANELSKPLAKRNRGAFLRKLPSGLWLQPAPNVES